MDKQLRACALVIGLFLAPLHAGCITINLPPGPSALQEYKVGGTGKDKVLLMQVSGVISSESREGFYPIPAWSLPLKKNSARLPRMSTSRRSCSASIARAAPSRRPTSSITN